MHGGDIWSIPEVVASANLNRSDDGHHSLLELLIAFDETTAMQVATSANEANVIFPGTVKHLIYHPENFDDETMLTGFLKISKNLDFFKNFTLGVMIKIDACNNQANFRQTTELLKLYIYYNHMRRIYISANVTSEYSKLGFERVLPLFTVMFENCKRKITEYFFNWGVDVEVAFSTEWPLVGDERFERLVGFVRFWEGMNDWAERTRTTVILSSAFEVAAVDGNMGKSGWWRLMGNETFLNSADDDYVFEDKREAALRQAPKQPSDDSATPFGAIQIAAILFLIFVITAVFTIGYLLKTRSSKFLTQEDIAEFFNGGDSKFIGSTVEGVNVNGPYKKTHLELEKKSFTINQETSLGSGAFGEVCLGTVTKNGMTKDVAVKMTKIPSPRTALRGLLFEIKILTYLGPHPNIVELVGAYTAELKKGRALVFLEYCPLGSLESYLRKCKTSMGMGEGEGQETDYEYLYEMDSLGTGKVDIDKGLAYDLSRWLVEIANGMEFISSKHIVHLDIATRNILLTAEKSAKITDFGLSRRMYDYQTYVKKNQEPLPWRWMAPESLRRSEFTEKSDVWAFGVLLWEIYSLGDEPYPGLSYDVNFPTRLEKGLRPGQPMYNRNSVYSVMLRCWATNPERRPTFSELVNILSQSSYTLIS